MVTANKNCSTSTDEDPINRIMRQISRTDINGIQGTVDNYLNQGHRSTDKQSRYIRKAAEQKIKNNLERSEDVGAVISCLANMDVLNQPDRAQLLMTYLDDEYMQYVGKDDIEQEAAYSLLETIKPDYITTQLVTRIRKHLEVDESRLAAWGV